VFLLIGGYTVSAIVAAIGRATQPEVSDRLLQAMMVESARYGSDAAGFWATTKDPDPNGKCYFSKCNCSASEFVFLPIWQMSKSKDVDLMVGHCRTSSDLAPAHKNCNNHPFISVNGRYALATAGKIRNAEFLSLGIGTNGPISQCYAELVLYIILRGQTYGESWVRKQLRGLDGMDGDQLPTWSYTLSGFMALLSQIDPYSNFSLALGERGDGQTKSLWLASMGKCGFYVADCRKSHGQLFVMSKADALKRAAEAAGDKIPRNTAIITFPTQRIWALSLDGDELSCRKFAFTSKPVRQSLAPKKPSQFDPPPVNDPVWITTDLRPDQQPCPYHEVVQRQNFFKQESADLT